MLVDPAGVESGKHQQILHQVTHPVGHGLDPRQRTGHVGRHRVRASAGELGVPADSSQRSSQLVARVRHEPSDPGLAGLAGGQGGADMAEHGVESCPHLTDLGTWVRVGRCDTLGQRDLSTVQREFGRSVLRLPVLVQDGGLGRPAGHDLGAQRALPLPGGQQKVGPGAVEISRRVRSWFVEGRLRPLAGRDELVVEPAYQELVEGDHAHGPHDEADHREQRQQKRRAAGREGSTTEGSSTANAATAIGPTSSAPPTRQVGLRT